MSLLQEYTFKGARLSLALIKFDPLRYFANIICLLSLTFVFTYHYQYNFIIFLSHYKNTGYPWNWLMSLNTDDTFQLFFLLIHWYDFLIPPPETWGLTGVELKKVYFVLQLYAFLRTIRQDGEALKMWPESAHNMHLELWHIYESSLFSRIWHMPSFIFRRSFSLCYSKLH